MGQFIEFIEFIEFVGFVDPSLRLRTRFVEWGGECYE
jgi:hypothetical protein